MTVTGTVQWMLDPLYNIYRLFKGKEGKLVSCLLGPSARLKIKKKGARERTGENWWKIPVATHEIPSLGRVVGCVLALSVGFSGRGFMRTPKSTGKGFYAVERLREPVAYVDLLGLRLRVWHHWRNLQNWSLLPLGVEPKSVPALSSARPAGASARWRCSQHPTWATWKEPAWACPEQCCSNFHISC